MDSQQEIPKQQQNVPQTKQTAAPGKPNEHVGFHFSSSLRISDPQTGQVLVQMRADT